MRPGFDSESSSGQRRVMDWPARQTRMLLWALLLAAPVLCGCRHLRLPAIDPSGRRIFLPPPNYTTLDNASQPGGVIPGLPQPAFTAPPQPPACPDPVAAVPTTTTIPTIAPAQPATRGMQLQPGAAPRPILERHGHGARRGRDGSLTLTPARMIAPVGSEVLLMSGLCGSDGYFVMRQPIQWMLSQDSVGHFVEVGGGRRTHWQRLFQSNTARLTSDFAESRTSTRDDLISRGTPTPNDDMWVKKGQSWISVTSATEGTSHVSVLAPKAENWDRRLQSATIHWIDAQWVLPAPAIVQARGQHELQTVLTRASNNAPIAGWRVKYEITGDGAGASFAPDNSKVVEVETDESGLAIATLAQYARQPGTTQIQIEIVRPPQANGDLPRLVVGQGFTSVTWTAAGLGVNVSGPASAQAESVITYRIDVSNPGDLPARAVELTADVPGGLEYVNSQPAGQMFGQRVEWKLGDVAPRSSQVVTVNCRAKQQGAVKFCAAAKSADNTAQDCADTSIFVPSLELKVNGPEKAEVGDRVTYQIEVTNKGAAPLNNVVITDALDDGLQHASGGRKLAWNLGTLQPNQPRGVAIELDVTKPGTLCHTVEAAAAGLSTQVQRPCLTATQPERVENPKVEARITGPADSRVRQIAEYQIQAVNTGNVPLTNVRVAFAFSPSMEPVFATRGHVWDAGSLVWSVAQLGVGQASEPIRIRCECMREDAAAFGRASVTSDQGVSDSRETKTRIAAAGGAATDMRPTMNDGALKPGKLEVTVNSATNPVRQDAEIRYVVQITNTSDAPDKNIEVTLTAPEGMTIVGTDPPVLVQGISPDKRSLEIVYDAIQPQQRFSVTIKARASRAGDFTFRVQTKSDRVTTTVERMADVTVTPKP